MKNKMVKVVSLLVASTVSSVVSISAFAETTCTKVIGKVKLVPEPAPACTIETAAPGFTYLKDACFSVSLTSTITNGQIAGVAGLTAESTTHPLQPTQTQRGTPAILNERGLVAVPNELGILETRRLFTARSALFFPKGTIYTADAGVIAGPSSIEQLRITGGTERYANAFGTLNAMGDLLGQGGTYFGKICIPSTP